jgi:hypothetical protein
MKTGRLVFAAVIAIAGILYFGGNAEADIWGAETGNSVTYAPSYRVYSDGTLSATDGGQGSPTAHSSVSDYRGNATSTATLRFNSGITPMLSSKAYVTADDSLWGALGGAYAIEQYTYMGAQAKELTLNVNLSGKLNINPTVYPSQYGDITSDTALMAGVYIFNQENFGYNYSLGTLLYEMHATTKGEVTWDLRSNGTYSETGQIVFTVKPSEIFYLLSRLDTPAQWYGSYSDAGSTLTMSFDDPSNLIAGNSPNPVPIPAAVWLLGSGMVGLVGIRRKFLK